jgi:NO-binding membrane sensor protein with MHYT domain
MAMIGFTVDGTDVRYDLSITVASWLTAVVVVGVGLFIVGYGPRSLPRVVVAGVLTGLGVAGMHYAGMDAMRLNGSLSYDHLRVGLSLVIAVVAATAALWFTVSVRRPRWIALSAAIMGVAVAGMHYTGMSAVSVHLHQDAAPVPGVGPLGYLIPMLVFVLLVLFTLIAAVLSPADGDLALPGSWSTASAQAGPAQAPAAAAPAARTGPPARVTSARWGGGR